MQITIHIVWVPLFLIFLLARLLSGEYDQSQLIVAFAIHFTSVFWFIAPYLLGKDIKLPSYTDVLKKGENDKARFVFFFLGGCGFIVSLLA